jgi:hypothetical protein
MLGVWILLLVTAPGIPIVWDEGEYMNRAGLILQWFHLGPAALSSEAIRSHWHFINYSEGHPSWFAIPIACGEAVAWLTHDALDPLMAARVGPMAVFSLACAVVAVRLRREYGMVAALAAPIALLTFPRIFSEAHFATQDGQLTAWWLMLWAADSPNLSPVRAGLVGVLVGLTSATKFTGWFAWIPVLASRVCDRPRTAVRRFALMVAVALFVYYVVNPPIWYHPISGLGTHFQLSLNRADARNIPTFFSGQPYDAQHSLPFYNTIVWLLIVTPVPTLGLGLLGLYQCLAKRTKAGAILIVHWATMMVVRALPGAPPHDGIRLFLPAFGFWCVFAAIGAQCLWELSKASSTSLRMAIRVGLAAAVIACTTTIVRYYPQTLSHYNWLVGGVRGAASQGMEPTYWWDSLDSGVLRWLNEHTQPEGAIAFSPVANVTLLQEWRQLRSRVVDPRVMPFTWYVLQNRPGMFSDVDRTLYRSETPAWVKYAGMLSEEATVARDLDVPLILVFSYEQYRQAEVINMKREGKDSLE